MKPHLKLFSYILLITVASSVSAQQFKNTEVKFLIDTTIIIMKNNAVNANKVNWDAIQKSTYRQASNLNNPYEMGSAMRYLYQSINDFHGKFFYNDSTFQWHHNEVIIPDSVMKEWNKGVKIKAALVEDDIGYLRMPYMSFGTRDEVNKKAQDLNDSLCSLLSQNIKGLVLDLRLNGGGAMYPMILGVEQLLSPGKIGSFKTKETQNWYLKNNEFLLDTTSLTNIRPKCSINAQNMPVVILTGPGTGSSGEFLVIAFKGRKKTVLLGDKTAGYVTSVAGFSINKQDYIYLSTGYGADREGRLYTEALQPDIPFTAIDKFNDLKNDEKVKVAMDWLRLHFN